MNHLRVALAFVFAPVLPCMAYAIAWAATTSQIGHPVVVTLAIIIVVAIAWGLIVGLPVLVALNRWWTAGIKECVLAGAVVALLLEAARLIAPNSSYAASDEVGATYVNGRLTPHGWAAEGQFCMQLVLLGAAIGFCFWVIAFWRGNDCRDVLPKGNA